jgi:hypothetical protein
MARDGMNERIQRTLSLRNEIVCDVEKRVKELRAEAVCKE